MIKEKLRGWIKETLLDALIGVSDSANYRFSPLMEKTMGRAKIQDGQTQHSMNQRLGNAWEIVYCFLALNRWEASLHLDHNICRGSAAYNSQVEAFLDCDKISKLANEYILATLDDGDPNYKKENLKLAELANNDSAGTVLAKVTKPDVMLINPDEVVLIQSKTPIPNKDQSREIKRAILVAKAKAYRIFPGKKISSCIAVAYNPHRPNEYNPVYSKNYFCHNDYKVYTELFNWLYGEDISDDWKKLEDEVAAEYKEQTEPILKIGKAA